MDHRFINLRVILIAIVVAALAQAGCKENTLINSKVVPSNSSIGVYDTSLACITHTLYDDTVVTSYNIGGLPIYQGVGVMTDPFFGTMTGATFFQVVPNSFNAALYDNQTIDSAILVLPYTGYTYGDTSSAVSHTQDYQVFYLADSIGYNTNYYAASVKPLDATPLSDVTTIDLKHLDDTFSYPLGGTLYTKGLRIKLNLSAFLPKLSAAQSVLTTSAAPATDFINIFKGVCVKVANPGSSNTVFPYFRLDGSNLFDQAGIIVYYHDNTTGAAAAPENYSFNTTYCAHFNSITRNYAGFPVSNLYTSSQANDSIIALENQPGASFDVVIPGVKSLPLGLINKAELQFTLLPNYTSAAFAGPEKIYPLGVANGVFPAGLSAGLAYNVADRYPLTSLTPLGVLDGYVHTFTRNGKTVQTYTIDIPRELMASIAAKNDTMHFHINGTQDFFGAFHMVAGGGTYPDATYRPKLFVVYSKLK